MTKATEPRKRHAGAPRSRANDPDRTRADILEVATAHFAREGLSGSRVDEIAEETHTSKRMLYYYFGNKEGLYRAVLERCYGAIRSLEAGMDMEALSPPEALARHVEISFNFHVSNPDFVRLVMVENVHRGEHIAHVPAIGTRAESVIGILTNLLDRGVAEGSFRAGIDPIDLHMTVSALCFYNVSNRYTFSKIFHRDMGAPEAQQARCKSVVDAVLRWVCVPGAAP